MADLMPTSSDDAQRQQLVNQFFQAGANLLFGVDSAQRAPATPVTVDVGTADDGTPYLRGSAVDAPAVATGGVAVAQSTGAVTPIPRMFIWIGLALLLLKLDKKI